MESKKLYKFNLDCGRQGNLQGLFVATPQEMNQLMGKSVSFGEVLGKHSYVEATMESKMFTMIEDDSDKVEWFEKVVRSTGHSPLDYLSDTESELSEEELEEYQSEGLAEGDYWK